MIGFRVWSMFMLQIWHTLIFCQCVFIVVVLSSCLIGCYTNFIVILHCCREIDKIAKFVQWLCACSVNKLAAWLGLWIKWKAIAQLVQGRWTHMAGMMNSISLLEVGWTSIDILFHLWLPYAIKLHQISQSTYIVANFPGVIPLDPHKCVFHFQNAPNCTDLDLYFKHFWW